MPEGAWIRIPTVCCGPHEVGSEALQVYDILNCELLRCSINMCLEERGGILSTVDLYIIMGLLSSSILTIATLPTSRQTFNDVNNQTLKKSVDHTVCFALLDNSKGTQAKDIPVCSEDIKSENVTEQSYGFAQ